MANAGFFKRFWPLLLFLMMALLLVYGIKKPADRALPSALIGQPIPEFALPDLEDDNSLLRPQDFKGQVWLLNVWASWCQSCRVELPFLAQLTLPENVQLIGLNYKDAPQPARLWLRDFGNPYQRHIVDATGHLGIDLGLYGVPETYVIDCQGIIRHRSVGIIDNDVWQNQLLPAIHNARLHCPTATGEQP